MTITDSMELYRNACGEAAAYGKTAAGSAESYVLYGSNSPYEDRRAAYLEPYYIRIIEAMFYEIMTGGSSPLLSRLCSSNGIRADLKNVQIDFEDVIVGTRGSYDLKPLLDGLNAAFSGDLSKCSALYFGSYSKDVFHGKKFSRNFNYIVWAAKALKDLDSNVAAVRAGGPAAAEEAKTIAITERQPAQEAERQSVPEPVPAEEMKSAAAAEAQTAAKAEGQP
ncbi:MAG: hypothetical protein Q4D81_09455, partial [Eubacteriales bacterium]|nr:hypothetical protein [Eubacteriales bacterium]